MMGQRTGTRARIGDNRIDGLWGETFWTATTLTYGFPGDPSRYPAGYTAEPTTGFSPVSDLQKAVVRAAFRLVESYTNLKFTDAGDAYGDFAFGRSTLIDTGVDDPGAYNKGGTGDVWFVGTNPTFWGTPAVADYKYFTHLHEIGHALGLKHPHEGTPRLPAQYDWLGYTVMSYKSSASGTDGYTNETYGFPTTFMPNDILALQKLYGVNYQFNAGDTVYRWDPASGQSFVNGVAGPLPASGPPFFPDADPNRVFMTIWDGGGVDTFDLSAYTAAHNIDLNAGAGSALSETQRAKTKSGTSTGAASVYNAWLPDPNDLRPLIENVIMGSGGGNVTGNQLANRITGGAGADQMLGGGGDDVLIGNAGGDRLVGDTGNDTLNGGVGNDNLDGGTGDDNLDAGDDHDILAGGLGNDRMVAGLGDDSLNAGFGVDFMDLGLGNNDYTGGPGVDTAVFAGNYRDFAATFYRPGMESFGSKATGYNVGLSAQTLIFNDRTINLADIRPFVDDRSVDMVVTGDNSINPQPNLTIYFKEAVEFGSGAVRIYTSDGTLFKTYAATDLNFIDTALFGKTGLAGRVINPNTVYGVFSVPVNELAVGDYYVEADAGIFVDMYGNRSAAITGKNTWNFRVGNQTDYANSVVDALRANDAVTVGLPRQGHLSSINEGDYIKTALTAGKIYEVKITPAPDAGPTSARVTLFDNSYNQVAQGDLTTVGLFKAIQTGNHVIGVTTGQQPTDPSAGSAGSYTIDIRERADDFGDTIATATTAMAVNSSRAGVLDHVADVDLIRVDLVAGQTYTIAMTAPPVAGLPTARPQVFELLNAAGTNVLSSAAHAAAPFTATQSGAYYVKVGSPGSPQVGTYTVHVATGTTPGLAAPTVTSGAVRPDTDIVFTFNQPITAANGNISLISGEDRRFFSINDTSQVTITGNTVRLNPTADLNFGAYAISMDAGAVRTAGRSGNPSVFSNLQVSNLPLDGAYLGYLVAAPGFNTARGTYQFSLVAGQEYDFRVTNARMEIRAPNQSIVGGAEDQGGGGADNARIVFKAEASGIYNVQLTASFGVTSHPVLFEPLRSRVDAVGTGGNDVLLGTRFDDVLRGGRGNDDLQGREDNDTLEGGVGADRLDGGVGADRLIGGAGGDTLLGFLGDDRIDPGGGNDMVDGGAGNDIMVLPGTVDDYTVLAGPDGALVHGTFGTDTVRNIETVVVGERQLSWEAFTQSFNALRYIASNPDLIQGIGANAQAGRDHWVRVGQSESRLVSTFDPVAYAAANPDVARAFGSDFQAITRHYITNGFAEGRGFSFDAIAYGAANPDVLRDTGLDEIALRDHYVTFGLAEGRPARGFDPIQYSAANPDLARALRTDAAALTQHWLNFGVYEFRAPSGFDIRNYAGANPDLIRSFGLDPDALIRHWINFGVREGRPTQFNGLLYGASNPDVGRSLGPNGPALLDHYLGFGFGEGRATSGFDVLGYAASNVDLFRAFGRNQQELLRHYLSSGLQEGRTTTGFDPLQYAAVNRDLSPLGVNKAALLDHWLNNGIREARASGGFDIRNYAAANPDVLRNTGLESEGLLRHWITAGRAEQRPTQFDGLLYAASNPDVARGIGPNGPALLDHYLSFGFGESRPISGFNVLGYAASNVDLFRAFGRNPVELIKHYVTFGVNEGRVTNGFDPLQYGAVNRDLSALGVNKAALLDHWLNNGIREGRASGGFDIRNYAAANPDVLRNTGLDSDGLLSHYIRNGAAEQRPLVFDGLRYAASNRDLATALGSDRVALLDHFLKFGFAEGRSTNSFEALRYAASNPDLIRPLGLDTGRLTQHFIDFGAREGRLTASFDPLQYGAVNPDVVRGRGYSASNMINHYVTAGHLEGRAVSGFDALLYGASNPDLARSFGADAQKLITHYVTQGIAANRPTTTFNHVEYAAANADLLRASGTDRGAAVMHYLTVGQTENRPLNGFNRLNYLLSYDDLGGLGETGAFNHWINNGARELRSPDLFFGTDQPASVQLMGSSQTGVINRIGDRDVYAVTLTASRVAIEIDINGTGHVVDPRIRVYDANGRLVASDDNSGHSLGAWITSFQPTSPGRHYIVVSAGPSETNLSYLVTVSTSPPTVRTVTGTSASESLSVAGNHHQIRWDPGAGTDTIALDRKAADYVVIQNVTGIKSIGSFNVLDDFIDIVGSGFGMSANLSLLVQTTAPNGLQGPAGPVFVYHQQTATSGILYYDADGSGGGGVRQMANINSTAALTAANFRLVANAAGSAPATTAMMMESDQDPVFKASTARVIAEDAALPATDVADATEPYAPLSLEWILAPEPEPDAAASIVAPANAFAAADLPGGDLLAATLVTPSLDLPLDAAAVAIA